MGGTAAYKYAKRLCDNCDVRTECLQYAQENQIEEGLWGGLTPLQRRKLRKAA